MPSHIVVYLQSIKDFDKSEIREVISIYLRSEIVLVNDDITTTIELHVYSCYIVDFCTGDSTLVADEEVKLEKALEIA